MGHPLPDPLHVQTDDPRLSHGPLQELVPVHLLHGNALDLLLLVLHGLDDNDHRKHPGHS